LRREQSVDSKRRQLKEEGAPAFALHNANFLHYKLGSKNGKVLKNNREVLDSEPRHSRHNL
jgi:hypothetical protein